ncbi:hypothetical protein ONZ45_g10090 [Pleurotus djamor]|nr:hypothetical protein ONZ45_g10090 [Pleurotus djamor]
MSQSLRPSSPFNRDDADAILRSSDGVYFRVNKLILTIASPLFNGSFSLTRSKLLVEGDRVLPIIPFDADAVILDILLRHCYPLPDPPPTITNLATLKRVLEVAQDYELRRVLSQLEPVYLKLGTDEIMTQPVAAYALSRRYKWPNVEEAAIEAALHFSHDDIQTQFEAVDYPHWAQDGIKLLRCHFKCFTATREFLSSPSKCAEAHIEHARKMMMAKGPLAIADDLESTIDQYNAKGYGGATGELFGISCRLRGLLRAVVSTVIHSLSQI